MALTMKRWFVCASMGPRRLRSVRLFRIQQLRQVSVILSPYLSWSCIGPCLSLEARDYQQIHLRVLHVGARNKAREHIFLSDIAVPTHGETSAPNPVTPEIVEAQPGSCAQKSKRKVNAAECRARNHFLWPGATWRANLRTSGLTGVSVFQAASPEPIDDDATDDAPV